MSWVISGNSNLQKCEGIHCSSRIGFTLAIEVRIKKVTIVTHASFPVTHASFPVNNLNSV
jgi:hypothetical protein